MKKTKIIFNSHDGSIQNFKFLEYRIVAEKIDASFTHVHSFNSVISEIPDSDTGMNVIIVSEALVYCAEPKATLPRDGAIILAEKSKEKNSNSKIILSSSDLLGLGQEDGFDLCVTDKQTAVDEVILKIKEITLN